MVRDHIVHILGGQEVEGAVHLLDKTAVDLILECEVGIRTEEPNLDEGTWESFLGLWMEHQDAGSGYLAVNHHIKRGQEVFGRVGEDFGVHSLFPDTAFLEVLDRLGIKILWNHVRNRYVAPANTHFVKEEFETVKEGVWSGDLEIRLDSVKITLNDALDILSQYDGVPREPYMTFRKADEPPYRPRYIFVSYDTFYVAVDALTGEVDLLECDKALP